MKIIIPTQSAEALKNKILKYSENDTLKTWLIRKDSAGNKYLTHEPAQWLDKALLRFDVNASQLEVSLTWWDGKEKPSEDLKGYYIGRFIEVLLVHFRNDFITLTITR
jgi:hypothetical protein